MWASQTKVGAVCYRRTSFSKPHKRVGTLCDHVTAAMTSPSPVSAASPAHIQNNESPIDLADLSLLPSVLLSSAHGLTRGGSVSAVGPQGNDTGGTVNLGAYLETLCRLEKEVDHIFSIYAEQF
ncbi:hypothetical protein J6590_055037 [Homalodisca vitripennis]|nr:hypothetical protein J6590_055037 [Homalodisca vitripennis]